VSPCRAQLKSVVARSMAAGGSVERSGAVIAP